jgi:hypothetical protein
MKSEEYLKSLVDMFGGHTEYLISDYVRERVGRLYTLLHFALTDNDVFVDVDAEYLKRVFAGDRDDHIFELMLTLSNLEVFEMSESNRDGSFDQGWSVNPDRLQHLHAFVILQSDDYDYEEVSLSDVDIEMLELAEATDRVRAGIAKKRLWLQQDEEALARMERQFLRMMDEREGKK